MQNKSKLYNQKAVDDLVEFYTSKNGFIDIIDENSVLLSFRLAVFHAKGYKSAVIKDVYLNEWSSAYSIKLYKKLPKKYQSMVDKL